MTNNKPLIIFPAIDLRAGKCVRLLRGDPNAQTVYADDPSQMARQFADDGAEWLHVVNLDGAFGDAEASGKNLEALQAILDRVNIPVQVGGGVRSVEDIERLLSMGVTRVILGTLAVERPRQVFDIIGRFGAKQIVVGIDVREGKVATHGWKNTSEVDMIDLGKEMHSLGVTRVIHTDISRDGALTGINLEASKRLGETADLKVIISGGVGSLNDIYQAKAATGSNIEGVIIGRALYAEAINLADALEVAGE